MCRLLLFSKTHGQHDPPRRRAARVVPRKVGVSSHLGFQLTEFPFGGSCLRVAKLWERGSLLRPSPLRAAAGPRVIVLP